MASELVYTHKVKQFYLYIYIISKPKSIAKQIHTYLYTPNQYGLMKIYLKGERVVYRYLLPMRIVKY